MHFSIKSRGFRIRRSDMCFYTKLKTFLMHKDLNGFISWVFRGLCRFEKMYREGQIKILEGVKPNDYSITVLDRGGQAK